MNTQYTIKNFRVFDENGVTVAIKPLTILTGCNSSGKSSIVKSLVLFNSFTKELKRNFTASGNTQLHRYKLDFTLKTTSELGNFRRIIHNGSTKETIECKYTIDSKFLGEEVVVTLLFALENSEMNGGELCGVTICRTKGKVIYSSFDYGFISNQETEDNTFNMSSISNNFFHFVLGQHLVQTFRSYEMCQNVLDNYIERNILNEYEGPSQEELEELRLGMEELKQIYCKKYGEDKLRNVISWFNDYDNIRYNKSLRDISFIGKYAEYHYDIVEKAESFGTLFYVPLYEQLYGLDKKNIRSYVESLIRNKDPELELEYAIEMVISSFEKSDNNTFGDYFKEKEQSFFSRKSIIWGHFKSYDYLPNPFNTSELNLYFQNKQYDKHSTLESAPIKFNFVYEVVLNLDYLVNGKNEFYKTSKEPGDLFPTFSPTIYKMFLEYARFTINDILYNKLHKELSYISTSIVNIKRLYSLEGNDDFTGILRKYFELRKHPVYAAEYTYGGWYPSCFINKWIQKLGIGKSIGLSVDEEGLGATIRLYNDDDKKGSLLAEQGYGITQLLVILLRIELAIMENRYGGIIFDDNLYMGNDTEANHARRKYREITIAIEEPEVHLHPKLQSMLAEIFVDAYMNFNIHFIVETHSEYIIRKLQLLVANKDISNTDISVLYVYDKKNKPDYEPQVKEIFIRKDGMLNGNFGEGFFDEADMLSMFLLKAPGNEE